MALPIAYIFKSLVLGTHHHCHKGQIRLKKGLNGHRVKVSESGDPNLT